MFQKAAVDWGGGLVFKYAGCALEVDVPDTSAFGELARPSHNSETDAEVVAVLDTGPHISME